MIFFFTIVTSVWYFPLGLSSRNKIYTESFWCTQFGTISIQCHLWGTKDKMLVEDFRWINPSWEEHKPRKQCQNGDGGTGPEDELCDLLLTCVGWVGERQKQMWKMSWLAAGESSGNYQGTQGNLNKSHWQKTRWIPHWTPSTGRTAKLSNRRQTKQPNCLSRLKRLKGRFG